MGILKDDPNNHMTQSESFKSKIKIIGNTPADENTKDVEIIVPLKYCEVNLTLARSRDCVITNSTGAGKLAVTETKTLCSSCSFINTR